MFLQFPPQDHSYVNWSPVHLSTSHHMGCFQVSNSLVPSRLPTLSPWAWSVPWPAPLTDCAAAARRGHPALAPRQRCWGPGHAPSHRSRRGRQLWAMMAPALGCSPPSPRCCWAPPPTAPRCSVTRRPGRCPGDHRGRTGEIPRRDQVPVLQGCPRPPHRCRDRAGCDPRTAQSESCSPVATICFGTWGKLEQPCPSIQWILEEIKEVYSSEKDNHESN